MVELGCKKLIGVMDKITNNDNKYELSRPK